MAIQAVLAATLGAFWSTLALMLAEPPFQFGPGFAEPSDWLAWPGPLARRPFIVIRVGCLLVAAAFALMLMYPRSVISLVVGAILFDFGVMAGLVSHQTIVTAIDPNARSRLNGLPMTGAMIGMSIGAAVAGWPWSRHRWTGVCLTGVTAGLLALLRSSFPPIDQPASKNSTS